MLTHAHSTEAADAPAPLSVAQMTLSHFRNYADLRLNVDTAPVILTGPNGSGKTNLLEAISLLVPGKGLRRATNADLQNKTTPAPWGIAFELTTPQGTLLIGTGRDTAEPESDRRMVQIDGKPARSRSALAEHVAIAWITPEMDRVLAEGPSPRRKLLDRLVYSFDPAHGGRVARYEKALRERMFLLRDGNRDAAWLKGLEDEMAKTGVAIAAARRHMLRELQAAVAETTTAFPKADLALQGFAEEALDQAPALLVEDRMRDALAASRTEDAQSGMTRIGPHRSDLLVTHRAKSCPADLCSTGEQKALLIAIMLAYTRMLTESRGFAPLLLLDDIVAHLDEIRRDALFEEITALNVQAWLTGTDRSAFASFLPMAQHGSVDQGQARLIF